MSITFLTRNAVLRGGFVAALALALAVPCFAGGTNNPAVIDIDDSYEAMSGTSLDINTVRFRAGQSADGYNFGGASNEETGGTYMVGYVYQLDDESGRNVRLTWFAFEPDSVKRSRNGISIRQRSDIALSVSLYGGLSELTGRARAGVVSGCSAKGKAQNGHSGKGIGFDEMPEIGMGRPWLQRRRY